MKKIMTNAFLVLALSSISFLQAADTYNMVGIPVDNKNSQELRIQNNTNKTVYVGVYQKLDNKILELYGDILVLEHQDSSNKLRRPIKPKGDVKLVFSTYQNDLLPDILPGSEFAKKMNCSSSKLCLDAKKGLISKNDAFSIKAKNLTDQDVKDVITK